MSCGSNIQNRSNAEDNLCVICGNLKVIQTSWTDTNPGRRFLSCTNSDCKDFSWVDPPMCRRSIQIIHGLLRRVNRLEIELQSTKARQMKMKVYLAATWFIVAVWMFGKILF